MPLSRQPSSSAVSCSPRASVNPSSYVAIDTLLKTLKTCSRRMQTAFSTFHDELQILERLCYKGKNQHRSALFWKRAAEIKRYGERLDGMGLPDVLALLRCSFFGATTIQNPKSIKGPWTHVPDGTYVISAAERLAACLTLVNKLHERLLEIFRSFKLAMQSGSFVQLILTLAAIVARMDALVPELRDTIQLGWTACHQILCILDPGLKSPVDSASTHSECVSAASELDIKNVVSVGDDVGSSVQRSSYIAPPSQKPTDMPSSHQLSVPGADSIIISDDILHFTTVVDESSQFEVSNQFNVKIARSIRKQPVMVNKTWNGQGEAGMMLVQKKAKRKRNEIDDIFG